MFCISFIHVLYRPTFLLSLIALEAIDIESIESSTIYEMLDFLIVSQRFFHTEILVSHGDEAT
jgi:hypothetical protein